MNRPADNSTQIQILLNQAAAGDESAYDDVVNHAAQRLHSLTCKMLKQFPQLRRWEDTSDVFQQAVIRLHRSLMDVKPDTVAAFFGLAATQIRRTLIDLARHHFGPQGEAANRHDDAGDEPGAIERQAQDGDEPETLAQWAEFHEAVGNLPDNERAVFELTWYSGLPQQEICEVLGVSVPTVKRRFRSARRILAKAMASEQE